MTQDAAEELLPCECDGFLFTNGVKEEAHTVMCPAYYRPAVAAALRAKDEQLTRQGVEREELKRTYDQTVERLEREIAKLKSGVKELS